MSSLLLRYRESGFLGTAFKVELWKFVMMYLMIILTLVSSIMTDDAVFKWVFVFLFGFFCGGALRDLQWMRQLDLNWPFRKKVLNWDKVEAIAAGSILPPTQD